MCQFRWKREITIMCQWNLDENENLWTIMCQRNLEKRGNLRFQRKPRTIMCQRNLDENEETKNNNVSKKFRWKLGNLEQ